MPLDSPTAINPSDYALVNVGPDGKFNTLDDSGVAFSVAMYGSSKDLVALTPAQPLPFNQFFHVWINGGTSGGVEEMGHNMLAGDGSTPGTSYTAMLARGASLKCFTPAGDQVILKISGGGVIDDLLSGSGQGISLLVVGEVPRHTVLSGNVRKAHGGTGRAYLGYTIWGLGNFGDVRVKMYSPPFQIGQYPFSPGSAVSKSSAGSIVTIEPEHLEKLVAMPRSMNRPFRVLRH
jgi:hypothetical protein